MKWGSWITVRILIVTVIISGMIACGGGGGGNNSNATSEVMRTVALFRDGNYVDYQPNNSSSEAFILEYALWDMGHTVTSFTGIDGSNWSDSLSGANVLVVAELTNGRLGSDLSAAAKDAVTAFVSDGGILFVALDDVTDDWSLDFINTLFGTSMEGIGNKTGQTLTYSASGAGGTPFESVVPVTVLANDSTHAVDAATLPSEARVIFENPAGDAALVYIPRGSGHIVISGWDWWNGKSFGAQDGGWWAILYRSVTLNASHPDVLFLSGKEDTAWREDAVDNLMQTGQFSAVDHTLIDFGIPSLAQVRSYDTLLVSSDGPVADTTVLGNVLADYVASGGGVVLSMFSSGGAVVGNSPSGRFLAENAFVIPEGTTTIFSPGTSLGTVHYPHHPIMAGVSEVDVGNHAYTTTLVFGSTLLADWADSTVAVGTREIGGTRRADIGFYPVSSGQYSGGWTSTTDGATLMANALRWTANLPEPEFDTFMAEGPFPMPLDSPAGSNCSFTTSLVVSGGPTDISRIKVVVDLEHTDNEDVRITLEKVLVYANLTWGNGVGDNGFENVVFDDWAGNAVDTFDGITGGTFTGPQIPDNPLTRYRGRSANGPWTLQVEDFSCTGDGGALNGWGIMVR